jgi:hypothetical protein
VLRVVGDFEKETRFYLRVTDGIVEAESLGASALEPNP